MTTKLTPDQLHRLIDEVAALAYRDNVWAGDLEDACEKVGCMEWLSAWGYDAYYAAHDALYAGRAARFAGLSAVLILLSEGG